MFLSVMYEGLDSQGRSVIREARTIGELPHEARLSACRMATKAIGELIGMVPRKSISFGLPVFEAFGMSRPEAKAHHHADLLLVSGCDVKLEHCR